MVGTYVLGIMGSGKTLFATLYALDYSKIFPNNKIYANYHLNKKVIKNFEYNPFLFFPISELEKSGNCLIIIDDVDTLDNLKGYMSILVNLSRKTNIDIIFTAQYYTQIPRKIRKTSLFEIYPSLNKEIDVMNVLINRLDGLSILKTIQNPIKLIQKLELYDTNEICLFPLEKDIIKEIKRLSETNDDIIRNVMLFTKNKSKQDMLLKKLKD